MTMLTQKSQVTVPKRYRTVVGLKPGDEVEFDVEGNRLVLHKKAKKLPFDKWAGYLGKFSTDEAMKELRG